MKKKVVGRRVLSILLCMMMVLCMIPMAGFTAGAASAMVTHATAIEKSDSVMGSVAVMETETAKTGYPLSDFPLKVAGGSLRDSATLTTYPPNALSVEWVNPDQVYSESGSYEEQFRVYATADPSAYMIGKITITVEQSSSGPEIPPAVIIEQPEIVSPVKYTEGLKVSDLTLTGGKANVEGEFAFTEPDRAVGPATTEVSVTFTPANPEEALPVEFTVPVTIEKGVIEIEEMPVFQYIYKANTQLEDLNLDWDDVVEPGKVSPSGSELDFGTRNVAAGITSEDAKRNMTVGDHTVNVWVIPTGRYFGGSLEGLYEGSWHDVIVRILPNTTTALPLSAVVTEANTLEISASVDGYSYGTCNGTVTYSVNGEVLAENQPLDAVVSYEVKESGSYTIEAVYTPAEGDGFHFLPASVTREVVLPHTVTVEGGSGSGSYKPGDTVRVEFDTTLLGKYDVFNGWVITNAAGETLDVGVVDLTQRTISFTMPDEAVTITADTSFSIQLFFQSIGEAILNFLMKVVEWFMGLFDGLGSLVG